jgi:hypothetical protein
MSKNLILNPNIIITHKQYSPGIFVKWVVNPHYTTNVHIDGRIEEVGEFRTWNEAYKAGEKYLHDKAIDKAHVLLIGSAIDRSISNIKKALAEKGDPR